MKHIKRVTVLILIVGITALMFAGCGSSTKTAENTTKAKYEKALKNLVAADIISQEQSDKVLVALMSTVSSTTTNNGARMGGGSAGGGSAGGGMSRSGGSAGGGSVGGGQSGGGQYGGGTGGVPYGGGSSQYSVGGSSSTTYNLSGLVRTGVITERQAAAIIKVIKETNGSTKKSQNRNSSQRSQSAQSTQSSQSGQRSQSGKSGQS